MNKKTDIPKAVKRVSRKLVSGKAEQVFKDKKKYDRRRKKHTPEEGEVR